MNAVILSMAVAGCTPHSAESADAENAVALLRSVREKNPWLKEPPLIVRAVTEHALPNNVQFKVTSDLSEAAKPVEASEKGVSRRLIHAPDPSAESPLNLDAAFTVSLVKTNLLGTPDDSMWITYSHIRSALEMDLGDSNLPEIARTEDGLSAFATRVIFQTKTSKGVIVEGRIHTVMGWWDRNSREVSGFAWNEGSGAEEPSEWMMEVTGVADEERLIKTLSAISNNAPKQWEAWVGSNDQTGSSRPN